MMAQVLRRCIFMATAPPPDLIRQYVKQALFEIRAVDNFEAPTWLLVNLYKKKQSSAAMLKVLLRLRDTRRYLPREWTIC